MTQALACTPGSWSSFEEMHKETNVKQFRLNNTSFSHYVHISFDLLSTCFETIKRHNTWLRMLLQYCKDYRDAKRAWYCITHILPLSFLRNGLHWEQTTYLCFWNISLQEEVETAANSKQRLEFKQLNASRQECYIWVNWDFYVEVWVAAELILTLVAEGTSCWPVQWDFPTSFPTSFPSFLLLRGHVSLESDCKPRCLCRQAAFGSHRPRRKHHSRKLRERSQRETYTQTAFWNFIYPWAGEINFMDELLGDILIL